MENLLSSFSSLLQIKVFLKPNSKGFKLKVSSSQQFMISNKSQLEYEIVPSLYEVLKKSLTQIIYWNQLARRRGN